MSWCCLKGMLITCFPVLWYLHKITIWPSREKTDTHWVTSNISCIASDLSWGTSLSAMPQASFPADRGDSEPMKQSSFQVTENYYWMSFSATFEFWINSNSSERCSTSSIETWNLLLTIPKRNTQFLVWLSFFPLACILHHSLFFGTMNFEINFFADSEVSLVGFVLSPIINKSLTSTPQTTINT